MSVGSLLGGAGLVLSAKREEEDALRRSRTEQLGIEQLNRVNKLRQLQLQSYQEAPIGAVPTLRIPEAMPVGQVAAPAAQPAAAMAAAAPGMLTAGLQVPRGAGVRAAAPPAAKPKLNATPASGGRPRVRGSQYGPKAGPQYGPKAGSQYGPKAGSKYGPSKADNGNRVGLHNLWEKLGLKERDTPRPSQGPAARGAAPVGGAPVPPTFDVDEGTQAYIDRIGQVESGGNYNIAAVGGASSAFGKYQFTSSTWVQTFKTAFPGSKLSDAQILAQRGDPQVQEHLMKVLTAGNARTLAERGLPVNAVTLRMAHFLGRQGAVNFLSADPNTPVEQVVGRAAANANPTLLKGKTVGQVLQEQANVMGGGGQPAQQQQAGAPQMAQAAPAAAAAPQLRQVTEFYRGNPEAIGNDLRVAMSQREQLVRRANLAAQAGMGDQVEAARDAIMQIDQGIVQIQASQAMMDLSYSGDPRRMAALWSYQTGQDLNIRPYTDGTFDLMSAGGVIQSRMSMNELTDAFMSATDSGFRQRKIEAQFGMANKQFESNLKILEKAMEQAGQMRIEAGKTAGDLNKVIAEQMLRGRNDLAVESLKQAGLNAQLVTRPDGGSSVLLYSKDGQMTQLVDPNAPGMEIDGVETPGGPRAMQIPGLMRRAS